MGKDRTLLLMNHGDRTGVVFDEHYSTGLQYVPLVEIQLDEFAGSIGPIEKVSLISLVMSLYYAHALVGSTRKQETSITSN